MRWIIDRIKELMTHPGSAGGGFGKISMPNSGPRLRGPALAYQITDEDALWACRMIIGEGHEDTLEVLECMMNRFGFLQGTAGERPTFAKLLQDYSQPINPRWRRNGQFCVPGSRHHQTNACAPHRLERRDFLGTASIEDLQSMGSAERKAVALALRWCRGHVRSNKVIGAVHFAHPNVVKGKETPENMIVHKGRNWFHADLRGNRTANWTRDTIKVVPSTATTSSFTRALAAPVAALAGIGVAWRLVK